MRRPGTSAGDACGTLRRDWATSKVFHLAEVKRFGYESKPQWRPLVVDVAWPPAPPPPIHSFTHSCNHSTQLNSTHATPHHISSAQITSHHIRSDHITHITQSLSTVVKQSQCNPLSKVFPAYKSVCFLSKKLFVDAWIEPPLHSLCFSRSLILSLPLPISHSRSHPRTH